MQLPEFGRSHPNDLLEQLAEIFDVAVTDPRSDLADTAARIDQVTLSLFRYVRRRGSR